MDAPMRPDARAEVLLRDVPSELSNRDYVVPDGHLSSLVSEIERNVTKDKLGKLLIYQTPCAKCGCGSYCHWDDMNTPAQGMSAVEWADRAVGIAYQRCPCKGYKAKEV